MTHNTKRSILAVPVPSTDFLQEAYFDGSQTKPAIRYQFEQSGRPVSGGIAFSRIAAMRQLGEPYCTAWHITDCYDVLVEVENSEWVDDLLRVARANNVVSTIRHFMIYLDSAGCFEIAAENWEPVYE